MPSDYKKICEDNIRRRGEEFDDIGHLISEQLYSDRSHFVYELLQNAEDSLDRRFRQNPNHSSHCAVQFRLFHNRLEFRHFGEPFNKEDVEGISDVLKGTKTEDFSQIGKFGIGFKSVYAFTTSPEIHSGDEHFVIKRYIRPEAKEPNPCLFIEPYETVFVFPFNHTDLSAEGAFNLILNKLQELGPRVLLFLRRIDEIKWSVEPDGEKGQYIKEAKKDNICKIAQRVTVIGEKNDHKKEESWLIFERPVTVPDNSRQILVEVGFRIETNSKDKKDRIVRVDRSPLVVYFPTEKDTRLGFLIQGPYRTTTARDNIRSDDGWNKQLITETAELTVESLKQLREMGLLSVSVLTVLPIKFIDSVDDHSYHAYRDDHYYGEFHPIFTRVRETFLNEDLLPANDGSFVSAPNAKIVRGAALMKLLNQEQLGALFQYNGEIKWLSNEITQDRTPDLRSYLMQELDVEEVDPELFARNLSKQFLASQDDEWFIRFYEFLSEQNTLWRLPRWKYDEGGILRNKPILRLQDGSHINPFRYGGLPNAYLAVGTDSKTSLPTVKAELSNHQGARSFLEKLGIPELDLVAEVVERILPKYTDESTIVSIDENKRDLEMIKRAYATDSQHKKDRLQKQLCGTPFILAENPSTGKSIYQKPDKLYFGSDKLRIYFSDNDSFACVNLDHPQFTLFKDLGVKETVRIHRKEKNSQGYVCIYRSHGWHRRGLEGFDPDMCVEGLEHAISNPTPEKSAFIWNKIAIPNANCIRGIVESSTRQTYEGSSRDSQISEFGKLLTESKWLPNSDGDMHKPIDIALDDLPELFVRSERLADQLAMKKDDIRELAEKIGISDKSLNFAKRIEYAPPEVQKNIELLLNGQNTSIDNRGNIPYDQALSETFSVPGRSPRNNGTGGGGSTQNPSRRREKTQEAISSSIENEGKHGEQFSFTIRKGWKGKDDQVRVNLTEWYAGQCQICDKTFTQSNGEPYFEGLYLVSYTNAEWIDRVGNVLCLCPWHSAMFQFGPKEVDEDIIQQILRLKVQAEGGDGQLAIKLRLCEDDVEIKFEERHLIDLQEMIKKSQALIKH